MGLFDDPKVNAAVLAEARQVREQMAHEEAYRLAPKFSLTINGFDFGTGTWEEMAAQAGKRIGEIPSQRGQAFLVTLVAL